MRLGVNAEGPLIGGEKHEVRFDPNARPQHRRSAVSKKRKKAPERPATVAFPALTLIANTSDIDHVWEMTKKLKTCMLTTRSAGGMRSRPMHALPDQSAGCLWFITDRRGAKEEEIRAAPEVCLAFAETCSNTYLSMTGCAAMTHDVAKIGELWSAEAQTWWPKDPDDADVRLLHVIPDRAEYWDARGNSTAVALILAAARLHGTPPELDGSRKVRLPHHGRRTEASAPRAEGAPVFRTPTVY